jgi:acyl-CoA thioesterase
MFRDNQFNGNKSESDFLAEKVVDGMMSGDKFSQWLGIKVIETKPGRSVLQMTVREEMLNGFDILHGGVSFSLADSALAFASNSHGRISVSLESVASYPNPAREGDVLTATATELSTSNKTATYDVKVVNQKGKDILHFRGIVYRTSKEHFNENAKKENQ